MESIKDKIEKYYKEKGFVNDNDIEFLTKLFNSEIQNALSEEEKKLITKTDDKLMRIRISVAKLKEDDISTIAKNNIDDLIYKIQMENFKESEHKNNH